MDEELAGFDAARADFEESLRRAPDAALRYKPAGEDYALGGLAVHVTDVLRGYAAVVDELRRRKFEGFAAPQRSTPAEDATRIREGFGGEARGPVVEEMRAAHMAFVDAVRACGAEQFTHQAAVTFGSDPYPTSPKDVLGWVADHYREHTQQIGDLVSAWAEATR